MRGPRIDRVVLVCSSCHDWQVDVPRRVFLDLGPRATVEAIGRAQAEHLDGEVPNSGRGTCVNPDGRIRVGGKWVDKPAMEETGTTARGVMEAVPLPDWWVVR
jgi:hypothetical protein